VLTVPDVSLRQLLAGAVLAALAWALLQWLGGWYMARQLSLAKQEERLPDQRVEVSFGDTDDGAGRLDQSS
jgi:hypothetical protein